ncbi:MAG: TolC family protein [Alistipes sp.]|nr:TolC family protein [Alistipes sp.]
MKHIILSIVFTAVSIVAWGQDIFTPVLQQIEENSTTLQALQQQMEADKLQNKTGLTPDNPEVSFGYLWGNPATIGNRKDVSVSQSFDFPTAYVQRSRLSNLQNNSVEYRYRTEHMQLLLSAKELCIELIYNNMLREMYAVQVENARRIAEAYESLLQKGEANRLEYNKAALNYATMENELKRIDLERERLTADLTALNGGQPIVFDATAYAVPALPADFEQWYKDAEANNPSLQYLRSEVEVAARQVKLSQAEGLPKMAVGYMSEFVAGERFQGVTVGVSIPLWQNKNRVKQARAAALASERVAEDSRVQYYNHLRSLYNQAVGLQQSVALYTSSLGENSSDKLLLKAFEKGELSLLEYLLEMEYFYECFQKRAAAERDLAHLLAELTAYTL